MAGTVVNDIVDEATFGRFHWTIVVLCGLLLIVDGYDVSIGVQKGPPIGVQKGPRLSSGVTGMAGVPFALVAA